MTSTGKRAARAAEAKPRRWVKGPRCAQDYADVVVRCLETAAEHVLNAGETLIKAKEKLDHGEWMRMFKGHPQAVARPIPFTARTGQRLMKIASHPVLSKATHASLLPRSWATLYELSRLPEPTLTKLLAQGEIHPGLERSRVDALVMKTRELTPVLVVGAPAPAVDPMPDPTDHDWSPAAAYQRLSDAIQAELQRCPADKQVELLDLLQDLRRDLTATLCFSKQTTSIVTSPECEAAPVHALEVTTPPEVKHVDEDVTSPSEPEFHCSSCDRDLTEDELVTVRECSQPDCEGNYWNGTDEGNACPNCNRPFTRVITYQGCPDCLEEDSVEHGREAAVPM